ncbi:MAG: single-stranded DNA-binding protein [Bacteroidales bacterium]|nr:single-stranded DNA-binding protein [Bacteroidales bacterium]
MSVNKAILVGNVGRDPEIRHLEGGISIARFTLATSESYKNKSGELVKNTEWHNIVAWRQLADLADKYIRKGSQIYVEGKITNRQYDDKDGNKKYISEIVADNIRLLGRKEDSYTAPAGNGSAPAGNGSAHASSESAPSGPAPEEMDLPADSDDLPF